MKANTFLFLFLFSCFLNAQTAGEAAFKYGIELTANADFSPSPGYASEVITLDFYDDGIIDLQLKADHSIGERGKYYKNLVLLTDKTRYQICSHNNYGYPELYEFGQQLICEDKLYWQKDNSITIGQADWNSTAGYLEFEDGYIYFESLTDSLTGWLKVSGNALDPFITLDEVGLNANIPGSVTQDSDLVDTDDVILEQVKVFPNPFNDDLEIELPSSNTDFEIQVLDISGRKIYENSLSGNALFNIDTDSWPKGTYVITFTNRDKRLVSKLIK